MENIVIIYYRSFWSIIMKLGRHEVLMAPHMCLGPGLGKKRSWRDSFPKDFFLCRLRSIATHRDHFVRRPSVCLSVCHTFLSHFPELCFAGDTCIPRNVATIFILEATTTNLMYNNDPKALGKTCCYAWFHSEVKFWTRFWRLVQFRLISF